MPAAQGGEGGGATGRHPGQAPARGRALAAARSDALLRGCAFVTARGDALAAARAAALAGRGGVERATALLWSTVHSEGDPGAADASSAMRDVSALRRALSALDELRALDLAWVATLCRALEGLQSPDGAFRPAAATPEATFFESGLLAGLLARTRHARESTLGAVANWVAEHWSPDALRGSRRAIAAAAACFSNVPHEAADEALQWCGRELERGLRAGAWDAVAAARVLVWSDSSALPGLRVPARALVQAIVAEQAADGGWGVGDASPGARVAHSLDALVCLARLRA